MKKRILAMVSVLILMLTIPAYAVQSRAPAVLPSLSFSGTKATCEVLVTADNYMDDMCAYLGEDTSPSAFRYAVRYEGHTDLAPYEFFECCNEKSDDEILGAAVQHYDVVEIDDGIKPAFFYKTEHGYELLFSFDAKTAKKNIREEID